MHPTKLKKDTIPANNKNQNNDLSGIKVKQKYCIGCGLCARIAPNNFEMIEGKAKVKNKNIDINDIKEVNEAIEKCPAKAIG